MRVELFGELECYRSDEDVTFVLHRIAVNSMVDHLNIRRAGQEDLSRWVGRSAVILTRPYLRILFGFRKDNQPIFGDTLSIRAEKLHSTERIVLQSDISQQRLPEEPVYRNALQKLHLAAGREEWI